MIENVRKVFGICAVISIALSYLYIAISDSIVILYGNIVTILFMGILCVYADDENVKNEVIEYASRD